ncbi:uncharacterized protein LOC101458145 [Ceratitis capitata]|uniref:(Mediterranean fruit fly) hypothetical protein n=1 Tax=Ceratitis capitata TaxID=7213 RepID=W8AJI1_CERCA|nr:uncharacterized protein LOC101458145 [Ceratitis capitata]CAD7005776.1 unnamed protein product [Ceratitis capitata]
MPARNRKKGSVNARLDLARKQNSTSARVDFDSKSVGKDILEKDKISPIEVLEAEETTLEGCICNREPNTFVCIFCKMFSFGRIVEACTIHPNVTYLMDFTCCPYCSGPAEHLHIVNMEYQRYFKT